MTTLKPNERRKRVILSGLMHDKLSLGRESCLTNSDGGQIETKVIESNKHEEEKKIEIWWHIEMMWRAIKVEEVVLPLQIFSCFVFIVLMLEFRGEYKLNHRRTELVKSNRATNDESDRKNKINNYFNNNIWKRNFFFSLCDDEIFGAPPKIIKSQKYVFVLLVFKTESRANDNAMAWLIFTENDQKLNWILMILCLLCSESKPYDFPQAFCVAHCRRDGCMSRFIRISMIRLFFIRFVWFVHRTVISIIQSCQKKSER